LADQLSAAFRHLIFKLQVNYFIRS